MKLGTFVGKGGISLTDAEIKELTDLAMGTVEGFKSRLTYRSEVIEQTHSDGTRYITMKFNVVKPTSMKDSRGDHYIPKYIRIIFRNRKGYDENAHPTAYMLADNDPRKPEYSLSSYSASIDLMG